MGLFSRSYEPGGEHHVRITDSTFDEALKLLSMATGAAAKGIAKAVTGKSEDVRAFEKHFADYLCGNSQNAKAYLLTFATEFGGRDEGLVEVAKAVRTKFWISEFAKFNRSK